MQPAQFQIQKAVREQILLRIALIGQSGSGKTFSALTLATGMNLGPICLLDTENGRGKVYADEFDYGYVELAEPRSPERYCEAINAIEAQGAKVLIIDSMYHEWQYILRFVDSLADKNEYGRWGKATPRHDKFLQTILDAKMHIIACLRGKEKYELVEVAGGKTKPKNVGLGPQFREGFNYENHVTFMLDLDGNAATADKDNTHAFEILNRRLTREDGATLARWAGIGTVPEARPKTAAAAPAAAPAAKPANSPTAERPTEIELRGWMKGLSTAADLDVLKSIWENISPRVKLCDEETIARFQGVKDARKNQLEAAKAGSKGPAAPAAASPADDGTGIFHNSGELRQEPAAAPVETGPTRDQLNAEGDYATFIRKAKMKKVLEGLAEAIENEHNIGGLTDDQARKLLAQVDARMEAICTTRKPAPVAA